MASKLATIVVYGTVPFAALYWIMQVVTPNEAEYKQKMQEHMTPQEIRKIDSENEKKVKQFREVLGLNKIQEELNSKPKS